MVIPASLYKSGDLSPHSIKKALDRSRINLQAARRQAWKKGCQSA
jgi:hypothetical protein